MTVALELCSDWYRIPALRRLQTRLTSHESKQNTRNLYARDFNRNCCKYCGKIVRNVVLFCFCRLIVLYKPIFWCKESKNF